MYKVNYVLQEESYTSKASFFDHDDIPKWSPQSPEHGSFSGKRISRGRYLTQDKTIINADVNGALNILRKSNVVSCEALYSSGGVITPLRIRLARNNSGGNLNSKLLKN